ncbi:MAG: hypothetical protein ACRDOL_25785 [Streptosporangiaceae bacterium]
MSELSIDELRTETGELLPEREALGAIIIGNIGFANAFQAGSYQSVNVAVNIQAVIIASFNHLGGGG